LEKHIEEEEKKLFNEQKTEVVQQIEMVENYDNLSVEVINNSQSEIPEIADSFKQLDLSPFLLDNISRQGYQKLTIIQRYAIPITQKRINIMACSQTGSGKTASFLIPIIQELLCKGPPNPDVPSEGYKKSNIY